MCVQDASKVAELNERRKSVPPRESDLITAFAKLRLYEIKPKRRVNVFFGSTRKKFAVAVEPVRLKAQSSFLC